MMNKNCFIVLASAVIVGGMIISTVPVSADESVKELKAQMEALQKRVEELESSRSAEQTRPQPRTNQYDADRWDPMAEMDRIQQQMNRIFQQTFSNTGFTGRSGVLNSSMFYDDDFDIKDNQDHYLISLDMQGFEKDKVDIQIDQHAVTISGQQSSQSKEEGQKGFYSSHRYGSFLRTLPLPADADTQKVQTKKEGGKLIITIPKKT